MNPFNLHVLAFVLVLAGCSSLQNAGMAEYSVKPIVTQAGDTICCEVSIRNGKEITSLEAHVKKSGDDYSVDLVEQGIKAFAGQQISADALKSVVDGAVKAALTAAGVVVSPVLPAVLP